MKKQLLLLAIVAVAGGLILSGCGNIEDSTTTSTSTDTEAEYVDVTPAEAQDLIDDTVGDIVILDVSPKYDEGHLPGSFNYYVGDDSLDDAIPDLDKDKTYLVYCHVDSASISGAEKLTDAGFEKVYRLEGNYAAWKDGGYPIEIGINAVGNYDGEGLATRSYLDGIFAHTVSANLNPPANGKFYEGWLVKGSDFFSTGKMNEQDGQYILEYTSDEDQRSFNEVVITEETEANGLDNNPEDHVLEGEF